MAYLLQRFVGVHADKRFQLADWRIRPLPRGMLKYAQQDTHYLLDIYDRLKQELGQLQSEHGSGSTKQAKFGRSGKGGEARGAAAASSSDSEVPRTRVEMVLSRSAELCLRTYSKPRFSADREVAAMRMWAAKAATELAHPVQQRVGRALAEWRDAVARSRDESPVSGPSRRASAASHPPAEPAPSLARSVLLSSARY